MTVHSVPEDAKAARCMEAIKWNLACLMELKDVSVAYLQEVASQFEQCQRMLEEIIPKRCKTCEISHLLQLFETWSEVKDLIITIGGLAPQDIKKLKCVCKWFYVMPQETQDPLPVLRPAYSKILPQDAGFDPHRLDGNVLLFIGHCMLSPIAGSDPVVAIPPGCMVMTYCDYKDSMPIQSAFDGLTRITNERRIVKNVGGYHIKTNQDVSVNYRLRGDSSFLGVGIYVVEQSTCIKPGSVTQKHHCSNMDNGNLQWLLDYMEELKCTSIVIIGCKN